VAGMGISQPRVLTLPRALKFCPEPYVTVVLTLPVSCLTRIYIQIPMVKGITSDLQTKRIALIHKRLAGIQRHAPLSECAC